MALVGVTVASLALIPFFFTEGFYGSFVGHERTQADCSGFEECVTDCAETGPSERYCATEVCAPQAFYGPTKVFECREGYLENGAWKAK